MPDDPLERDTTDAKPRDPVPLSYGRPEPSTAMEKTSAAIMGVILSVIMVGFVGAALYPYPIGGPPTVPKPAWRLAAMFFTVAVLGLTSAVLWWGHRPLARGGWFLMGALIGLGIVGLLEGACYANP